MVENNNDAVVEEEESQRKTMNGKEIPLASQGHALRGN